MFAPTDYVVGLHYNNVFKSILERRKTRLFARGGSLDTEW